MYVCESMIIYLDTVRLDIKSGRRIKSFMTENYNFESLDISNSNR